MINAVGHSRVEGRAKVTGAALYAADTLVENPAYGVFATSPIPLGRVTALDTDRAESASGVIGVLTHRNLPKLRPIPSPPAGQSYLPLQDDRIRYEGQPIALIVAETLEQAQHAASLVSAQYEPEPANVDFRQAIDSATTGVSWAEQDTHVGDTQRGLADAAVVIERHYHTSDRHHSAMEPSATIAEWQDGKLIVHDSTQWIWGVRAIASAAFQIPAEDIQVHSPIVGGGFGCKGYIWPHQLIAAAAARELGRPVKVVLSRSNTFTSHGYQPATEQHVTLGATREGRLTAIRHRAITPTSRFDGYVEYAAIASRAIYECPNIETRHRIVPVDRSTPTPMRAPHEGPSLVGMECAMDELAYDLGVDPVELRLKNYAETDPTSKKPFSSKALRECYRTGMERFGWTDRSPEPRSMPWGSNLIGWGMATAMMQTFRFPSKARVSIVTGGRVLVEAGSQEIGTGTSTVVLQVASEVLDIPVERIELALGDTSLPETGGTFGSSATMGVGSAVHDAASKLRTKLMELSAGALPRSAAELDELLTRHGVTRLSAESDWSSDRIVQRSGLVQKARELSAEGAWAPAAGSSQVGEDPRWSMYSWGAVFVEVKLDEDFMIPRLTRAVGVYSAGRIMNAKTARSQMLGGLIWGTGQALLERSPMDRNLGRFLSKNLAGYLVPVNADIPELDVSFVDEFDDRASAIGARGIGELRATGVGPAIANAVFHATGKRVRELPIRPEHLI